ncbi:uncharacterized protein E0L32_002954 [Thyridium curvatum]|uniref:CUE domain-containing protein n=1 Tax=Thyridium curvatum TaxID=1093900 RepID=A0A507BED8_9PEZI|nr:uncharacterized protein E0L32_002954 [Thyridium curvatum]TPX17853.1 hypothetical protein E0L32_002954 [Thyridium curvatum]
MTAPLPPFAAFPSAEWRRACPPGDWAALLGAWTLLAEAHLSLPDDDFARASLADESLSSFLPGLAREAAESPEDGLLGSGSSDDPAGAGSRLLLLRSTFRLAARVLRSAAPPPWALQWSFLSDLARLHGRRRTARLLASLSPASLSALETSSLQALKKALIADLDKGINGDLRAAEQRLVRLNFLVGASPARVAAFFLAGDDYLDALLSCFRVMNPPLRRAIVTNLYLCLAGLLVVDGAGNGEPPKVSMLTDRLYALKAAADAHRAGPLNANDSLVAELVTTTPILQHVQRRLEAAAVEVPGRTRNMIRDLASFRKPGAGMRPRRPVRRKIDKGKGVEVVDHDAVEQQVHVHRMSQITQIQDLFPELGSGFVARLLDEYGDDTEQVIAHLLEDTLPPHLKSADRGEQLTSNAMQKEHHKDLAPKSTPPPSYQLPTRHNVFDDDEMDRLVVDTSKLHFGKHESSRTAEDILQDRSTAPNKAAILSALAAFDSDDDERDDTYDAEDVGGTVDAATEEDPQEANEEALFRAFLADPYAFDRDAGTRRGIARAKLKEETGMTDEAIEGWGLMLARNPQKKRRLENKFTAFTGVQNELASTAWRASPAGSGAEDSEADGRGTSRGRGGGRGRGGRGRGGGGRGRGGNVAGPTGEKETEQARRRKEAAKSSRANHNRRDQRARKMARGGFAG